MAHLIIDHRASGCFGTSLALCSRYNQIKTHDLFEIPQSSLNAFFDLLVGQSLHEAFLATEQSERGDVHKFQLSQNCASFACGESVLCQLTLVRRVIQKSSFVAAVLEGVTDLLPANGVFALLDIVSLMALDIGA